jgi:hypothetical protein
VCDIYQNNTHIIIIEEEEGTEKGTEKIINNDNGNFPNLVGNNHINT